MDLQVLIVGAGPVGLTAALELARYGVAVRIVDQAEQRTDKSKALVVWSRSMELLERSGCAASFIAAGHKVDAANIVAGDKVIGRVSLAGVESPYPFALMLPQADTERLLEEHLGRLGVAVERRTEVLGFEQTPTDVTTRLRRSDGTEEALTAAWLIGCDGAHSIVRHTLGLAFGGETLKSDWILADLHIAGLEVPDTELALFWHEDGVLAVFPISPGRYRVIMDLGQSKGALPTDPTLEEVQAVVDRRGPGKLTLSDPIWLAGFRINERKVENYRSARVFVAGDAAHVHSPAGGQGMNTGMQDAFNLTWKLALVCHGACAENPLLDSFSVERSAVGAQVLADAGRLTAVAIMKNHTAQAVRNWIGSFVLGLAPVREAMAKTLTEVSVGYAHSPLNGPGSHGHASPAPGERVAPVAGQVPVGAGEVPRFALFSAPSDAVSRLLLTYRQLLEPTLRPPLGRTGMLLVRPDGYAACVAKDGDFGTISAYLDGLGVASTAG
jgi:2-polyprenyl-6-methoxyphenol hydroxylase-like FAD-dependent oxidoreductase